MKRIINHHKIIWLVVIWLFSFYALSVKFWQGEENESYLLFTIEILKWFSVWSTVIALFWSSLNLIVINNKYANTWISGYNFRIFSTVYNLMAGIVFWCGIFTYGWDAYIISRTSDPLSFSVTITGHLIIPILLTIYSCIYCDYYVKNSYYKKDFFLSLIFPALYGMFMVFHALYWIHDFKVNDINLEENLGFISPYWFLSWFIYGWGYWFGAMLVFGIITLSLVVTMNLLNNLSLKNRKVKIIEPEYNNIKK